MARYAKGANAEREMARILWDYGFAMVRAAGSGKSTLPSPDMVAVKNGRIIAFECKAWKGKYLNIEHEQMDELVQWCKMANAEFFIAWKVPHKGWFLINKKDMKKTEKSYAISVETAEKKGKKLESLIHKKVL